MLARTQLLNRNRCVAAPDSLKNENFCCDHNILINPAAKCPSATLSATVHPLSVSDAEELSLKPLEALESDANIDLSQRMLSTR